MIVFIFTAVFIAILQAKSVDPDEKPYLPQILKSGIWSKRVNTLTLKCQTKIAADYILIFSFYLLKKIRLDF